MALLSPLPGPRHTALVSSPHSHDLRPFVHAHKFGDAAAPRRERALWWVTVITLATMGLELVVGYWSGSLALVADGWHMGTHALALGGAALAARIARRAHGSARFAFGGWKIEVLAAYSSGLLLLAVSVWIAIDAIGTLLAPHPIAYAQAMVVAVDRPGGQRRLRAGAQPRRTRPRARTCTPSTATQRPTRMGTRTQPRLVQRTTTIATTTTTTAPPRCTCWPTR